MLLNETHDLALRSRSLGRFVIVPGAVQTSMRRFRTYGYARTIVKEYIASTILYYATGRTSAEQFRPAPARGQVWAIMISVRAFDGGKARIPGSRRRRPPRRCRA